MTTVTFFDIDYLKANSPISMNIDDDNLVWCIVDAQEIKIKTALKKDLYDKLIGYVENNTLSSHTDYETLVEDYVVPALLKCALVNVADTIRFKFKNTGVINETTPNSTQASFDEYRWRVGKMENLANHYLDNMIAYIENNPSKYPEYYTSTTVSISPSESTQNYNGFFINRRKSRNCGYYPEI